MAEIFSNFGQSTLSSGINNSVTSLTVASAATFPNSGNFRIKIDNELLFVTAVSGTNFTVTRGVESTSAASHSTSAVVEHVLSRQGLLNAVSDGVATGLATLATVAASGDYDDLSNTPTLATVATSGSYSDLSDKPTVTASRALVSDGSGVASASSVTATELGYLSGVTSAIQTQLGTKANTSSLATVATSGSFADLTNKPAQTLQQVVVEFATEVATGDGQAYFVVTAPVSGLNLTGVHACVITAGTTGTTDIQIARDRGGSVVDMLSTKITIDSTEKGSDTAATPAVINTSNDDVQNYDVLRIDVDAVSSTAPEGLIVTLIFS